MRNMKKWKRLMAVGLCCAMMFSMSVGVSATETQKTDETAVETEKVDEKADETADESDKNINKGETILQGDSGVSGNVDDKPLVQADGEELEEAEKVEEIEEEEDEAAEYAIDTQADSEGLPEMEWDGKFTVSHEKEEYTTGSGAGGSSFGFGSGGIFVNDYEVVYTVALGDEWKDATNGSVYVDGVRMRCDLDWYYTAPSIAYSFKPIELSSKPLNVTFKIAELKHYSNGMADGVAKDVEISFVTEVENIDPSHMSENSYQIPTYLVYDGTQDLVFPIKNGTGDWAIKEISKLELGTDVYGRKITNDYFTYDAGTGEVKIPYWALNAIISDDSTLQGISKGSVLYVRICEGTYQNGKAIGDGGQDEFKYGLSEMTATGAGNINWTVEYVAGDWSANGEMPEFIDKSYEFDGTQDMVFNFKNGTGDNAIKAVKEVFFPIQEQNAADKNGTYLAHFRIGNYGTSFNYDIEKGQVTIYKHAVSAIVYGEYTSVSNVYGGGFMVVELANGQTRTLYAGDGDANWSVKILEKSSNATGQHRIPAKEGGYTVEDMQILVNINKDHDVVIYTPEGVVFTFAKGTMRMIDGKDNYPFGVEIIADFSKSGITYKGVTSDIFACRINFEYSGELPGTAKVSIPVDNKWNGQTLYYYQVGGNGETLLNTEKSAVVENGLFEIMQEHCSDYVILSKLPKELGVTGTADIGNGNNGNTSTQGSTNTASENNATPQFKPVNTNAAPRTGDAAMVLLFIVLCGGACAVGVPALKARRRTR